MVDAQVTQRDSTMVKMILSQIKDGDLSTIKSNLSKYNVDLKLLKDNQNEQNAFFYAALIKDENEAINVFRYFKEMGLDPTMKDKYSQTCLYYTCREGKVVCSRFLIEECHLKVNEIDAYGQNPIYYAVRDGRIDVVKLMIEKGSNINIEDKFGQNCIFYSVREGHYDVTALLIENGANVNQVDKKKMTPYSFAVKYNQGKIAELLLLHGAIKPDNKNDKDKKAKKTASKVTNPKENKTASKSEFNVEEIQKPKKYVLVQIDADGKKIPLKEEELQKFKNDNPRIFELLEDKEERKKLCDSANPELIYFDSWEKQAKKLMNSLWKSKGSDIFHKAVDPEELGIPDYFDIIKKPMDFGTIKKKLNNNSYTNFSEFCSDINLTFSNCFTYNGERSPIGGMCNQVKNEYNKLYNQLGMQKFI